MKIMLISPLPPPMGGIATWTERYCEVCAKAGVDIDLLNTGVVGKRLLNSTAKTSFSDEFVRTKRIFGDLKVRLKDTTNYAAVHLNTSCGTFGLFRDYLMARRIKKKNIRLVTHYHCDIPYWIHNAISKKCLEKLARLSDVNLVLCENSRNYLEDNFGVSSVKIPNFIDDSAVLNGEKQISEKIERAFFVGRVSEAKGAKELYALAERLPQITFELVGEVDETVSSWKKPTNVELVGAVPHDKIASYMDKADVFVFPTYSEGFSLALTEAMARGLPAVTTDAGANFDMVEDKGGTVVAIGDIDAVEKALLNMSDAEVRRKMSDWNIEKVKTGYLGERVMEKLLDIYKEV